MPILTFISKPSGRPICKIYDPEHPNSPRDTYSVKLVNSREEKVKDIKALQKAVEAASAAGEAYVCGRYAHTLKRSSRAGMVTSDPLSVLVLDIDGIDSFNTLPEVLEHLGIGGHWYWRTSSSFGVKRGLRGHCFCILPEGLDKDRLKQFILWLNVSRFGSLLEKNESGLGVKWILDPVTAFPHTMITIAPMQNHPDPGLASSGLLDLGKLDLQFDEQEFDRDMAGLHRRLRLTPPMLDKKNIRKNVPLGSWEETYRDSKYVHGNINGGDSNAYYYPIANPEVVYNFKDEPPFRLKDLDQAAWQSAMEDVEAQAALEPRGFFMNYETGKYNMYDFTRDQLVLTEISISTYKTEQERFRDRLHHAVIDPPFRLRTTYDPEKPVGVDLEAELFNMHMDAPLVRGLVPPENPPLTVSDTLDHMQDGSWAPHFFKCMEHACAGDEEFMKWFVNWLAYVIVLKKKPTTAPVLHGTEGTGKGNMFNYVIKHLVGPSNYMATTPDKLEKYNKHAAIIRLQVFDEATFGQQDFHKWHSYLKTLITEPTLSVRAMYTDLKGDLPNYCAVAFLGNDPLPVYVPFGDRRMCVAPRQEEMLVNRYPKFGEGGYIADALEKERKPLLDLLFQTQVDESAPHRALENEAKTRLKQENMTAIDGLFQLIREGDMDSLVHELSMCKTKGGFNDVFSNSTKSAVVAIQEYFAVLRRNRQSPLPLDALMAMAHFTVNYAYEPRNFAKFRKLCRHHNVPIADNVWRVKWIWEGVTVEDIDYLVDENAFPPHGQGTPFHTETIQ